MPNNGNVFFESKDGEDQIAMIEGFTKLLNESTPPKKSDAIIALVNQYSKQDLSQLNTHCFSILGGRLTLLRYAVETKDSDLFGQLLTKRLDPFCLDDSGFTTLFHLASTDNKDDFDKALEMLKKIEEHCDNQTLIIHLQEQLPNGNSPLGMAEFVKKIINDSRILEMFKDILSKPTSKNTNGLRFLGQNGHDNKEKFQAKKEEVQQTGDSLKKNQ